MRIFIIDIIQSVAFFSTWRDNKNKRWWSREIFHRKMNHVYRCHNWNANVCLSMCFGNRTQEMDSFYRRKSRYRFEGELNLSRCISRSYSSSNVFEDRVDNFSFPCGPKQDDDNQLLLRRVNRKYYFKARSLTSLKIDCSIQIFSPMR